MKSILVFSALVLSVPAMASQNLELAGDCKPNVEKVLTALGDSNASVTSVDDVNGKEIIVSYMRSSSEGVISGEAKLLLKNTNEIARGPNVYMIQCELVSAEILDERAD